MVERHGFQFWFRVGLFHAGKPSGKESSQPGNKRKIYLIAEHLIHHIICYVVMGLFALDTSGYHNIIRLVSVSYLP